MHAVLLVRFFSQSSGAFQTFLELLLALLLGLAAALVAGLCRRSPKTLSVFLPLFGVLGFFPRPLTWIPAGVLLVSGGMLAAAGARRHENDHPRSSSATLPGMQGAPLHWSEAARLGLPGAGTAATRRAHATGWSAAQRAGAAALAVLTAAVVVILSLGTITVGGSHAGATTGGGSSTLSVMATVTQPATHSGGEVTTTSAPPPATSTSTTTPPADEEFVWYTDDQYGFAIKYPAAWRNTDPTEVGERTYREYAEAYADAFVPAAFADWGSPTFNGCYLDYVWIEVWDEATVEVPSLPEFRNFFSDKLAYLATECAGVEALEPLHDVTLAGMRGTEHVWSIFFGGRTLMLMECVLVGEGRAYLFQLAAVQEDWGACRPVFEEMLQDFTVSTPEPLS